MLWYDVLNIIFITAIAVISLYLRVHNHPYRKYWFYFFVIYGITELVSIPFALMGKNNIWLYNLSKPLQFLLLLLYFLKVLASRQLWAVMAGGTILALLFLIFQDLFLFSSLAEAVYACVVLICCVRYFSNIIKRMEPVNLAASEFWFISSLFVFYGLNLCVNGSMSFLISTNMGAARKLFYLMVYNSIIFYSMILYALCARSTIKATGYAR